MKDNNLVVGVPDVRTDTPSHVKGTREGNATGNYEKQKGHLRDGRSTSERSTGIGAKARDPIDPRMPNISPP